MTTQHITATVTKNIDDAFDDREDVSITSHADGHMTIQCDEGAAKHVVDTLEANGATDIKVS